MDIRALQRRPSGCWGIDLPDWVTVWLMNGVYTAGFLLVITMSAFAVRRDWREGWRVRALNLLFTAVFIVLGTFHVRHFARDIERHRGREAFVATALATAVRAAPDPRAARIVTYRRGSIGEPGVCGWIDLGGGRGAVPFVVLDYPRIDPTYPMVADGVRDPRAGGLPQRVDAAYTRAVVLHACRGRLGPTPASAATFPGVDEPLTALWRNGWPFRWAIIPALGDPGVLALTRIQGGGIVHSPAFPTPVAAQAWIQSEGTALAETADRAGQQRMAQFDACLRTHLLRGAARNQCYDR